MNLYNRYFMRAHGEQQHQAQSPAEQAVFSLVDLHRREPIFIKWDAMDEEQKNAFMEKLKDSIQLSIDGFRR